MLTVTVHGACESARAMQIYVIAASDSTSSPGISASHPRPCSPLDQHNNYDGCDTCSNCVCHAPFATQQFQLHYNPIILNLAIPDPFKRLPEVYLSKFIPPHNFV